MKFEKNDLNVVFRATGECLDDDINSLPLFIVTIKSPDELAEKLDKRADSKLSSWETLRNNVSDVTKQRIDQDEAGKRVNVLYEIAVVITFKFTVAVTINRSPTHDVAWQADPPLIRLSLKTPKKIMHPHILNPISPKVSIAMPLLRDVWRYNFV